MNAIQNKQLHSLLTQTGLMPQKATLVNSYTKGRSESSKELHQYEAADLIRYLQNQTHSKPLPHNLLKRTMRRKMIAIAHQMNWKLPNGKADMQRLNDWCIKQTTKKRLNDCSIKELSVLLIIFEEKVFKQFLQGI